MTIACCDNPMVENPVKNNNDPLVDHHQSQYRLGRHLFISVSLVFNLVSLIPEAKTSLEPRGLVNRQTNLSPLFCWGWEVLWNSACSEVWVPILWLERFSDLAFACAPFWRSGLSAHSWERFRDLAFACAPFWRSGAPEDLRAFHQVALKSSSPRSLIFVRLEKLEVCPRSQNKSMPQSACLTEKESWPIWVRSIGISFYGVSCVRCFQQVYPFGSECNATGGGREREGEGKGRGTL